jgi:HK97 gp10 family phage protein
MAQLQYVKGLEGILDTLKRLPPELVSKGGGPVRVALRKGGVVFQKEAQENVRRIVAEPNKDGQPSDSTGTLEKAIIVSRKKPAPGFNGERYHVRVKRGAKHPQTGVTANKYGGILEFGYESVPAKSWLRTAFETKKQEALDTVVSELRKRVDAAVKKARKKGLIE